MSPLRLIAWVVFMALGAALALTTQPLYPTSLNSWVVVGQEIVSGKTMPTGPGIRASAKAEAVWTVPTGLITVRDVTPTAPGGCVLSDCPPAPLLSKTTGKLKVSLQITPLAVVPETDYTVVLGALDGHIYDSVQLSWTREDLIGIDLAERSVIHRKETVARHNRRVDLEAPYDDVSIPMFVKDYNEVVGTALKAWEAAKSQEFAIDPMAAPIIAALFPEGMEVQDQQASVVNQAEIDHVVNQHFTLELVEAQVFSARLMPEESKSSSSSNLKC